MKPETDEQRKSRAWQFSQEARRFYDQQQWAEAAAQYEKAIEADPDEINHCYNLGLVRQRQGELEGARQAFLQALNIDENDFGSWYCLAGVSLEQKDYQSALEAYEAALEIRSDEQHLLSGKAIALHYLGRHHEALLAIEDFINIFPDDANAHFNRGLMFQTVKQFPLALASYQKAAALNDDEKYKSAVGFMTAKLPPLPRQLSLFDAPAPVRKPSLFRRLFSRWVAR